MIKEFDYHKTTKKKKHFKDTQNFKKIYHDDLSTIDIHT